MVEPLQHLERGVEHRRVVPLVRSNEYVAADYLVMGGPDQVDRTPATGRQLEVAGVVIL